MLSVDVNCDMGEGYAADAAIMPFISSVNIACGYHAGDADTMRRTVALALQHNVAIGAHPSYADRKNFGRNDLLGHTVAYEDIVELITTQLYQLQAICHEIGATLHHVKPHGALYNRAAKDARASALICQAVRQFDTGLLLYGLSGSIMKEQAALQQLGFVNEVFADRTYQPDGSLTPRNAAHALIDHNQQAIDQVLQMLLMQTVTAVNGSRVPIVAETICLHGDGANALAFTQIIVKNLQEHGIKITAPRP